MDFNEYQRKARQTAIYHNIGSNFIYPTLGIVGEAGEIAEKVKRVVRVNGVIDEALRREIAKELGDVLWYLAALASELGLSLDDIAKDNLAKLQSRKDRQVLHGRGDNR